MLRGDKAGMCVGGFVNPLLEQENVSVLAADVPDAVIAVESPGIRSSPARSIRRSRSGSATTGLTAASPDIPTVFDPPRP
jgi:hypothetical protein